jgi:hypothetical protein
VKSGMTELGQALEALGAGAERVGTSGFNPKRGCSFGHNLTN